MACVSKKFYSLITTPHAWRTAFSRYFPGQSVITSSFEPDSRRGSDQELREHLRSAHRLFTRLTGLASWRSEYILRTRLLRSLGRGKPVQIAPGHGVSSRANSAANNANPVVMYTSQLPGLINHIHGVYNNGKKSPRFVHGTDDTGEACSSDPNVGKVDAWGLAGQIFLAQFSEVFVGSEPYGVGDGPAGLPNSMDVSQPFGMVYGEGIPGGQIYFIHTEEAKGRFLRQAVGLVVHEAGITQFPEHVEAISAVWIAKSHSVPTMTDGLIGLLSGSTLGVVTAYSFGVDRLERHRILRGQTTARWVLSPGVPIISITVDDSYSLSRKAAGRVWAVALNALGEVFYLTTTPSSALFDSKLELEDAVQIPWHVGRTVHWHLVESSRRVAHEDPYGEIDEHGSYSPRSSWEKMHLSKPQIIAETEEIEKFLAYSPSHFRRICEGWDMRRRLEVDFAGDDGNGAGEGIFVIRCGLREGEHAEIKRYTRWKSEQAPLNEYPVPITPPTFSRTTTMASLFGGSNVISPPRKSLSEIPPRASLFGRGTMVTPIQLGSPEQTPSTPSSPAGKASTTLVEEWRSSILSLEHHSHAQITASAIDMSTYAILTVDEDPLYTINGKSDYNSPLATPSDQGRGSSSPSIPGSRARFLAIGTKTGDVILWNMRGPQSANALVNELHPVRSIYTDSPQICCLAVSALYIVHGGNDGLVQAWDPLASSPTPIRTLNSRFASRARRRLNQAEQSFLGVGINLYAAGAISLDPDPTVLRGMVSLGTHLRYWSYSSSAADQYQSKKRRMRHSLERGSNTGQDKVSLTGRGALYDYIANEQHEVKAEKVRKAREDARLQGRFGVDLGGMTEDEALRYAEMVSAETFQKDEEKRMNDSAYLASLSGNESSSAISIVSYRSSATPSESMQGHNSPPRGHKVRDSFNQDLEEAIRLSMLDGVDGEGKSPSENGMGEYGFPFVVKTKVGKKGKRGSGRRSLSSSPSTSQGPIGRIQRSKQEIAVDDLEFALQLSLAEEQSRLEAEAQAVEGAEEDFPVLPSTSPVGKGKGRA